MPFETVDRSVPVLISPNLSKAVNEKIRVAGSLLGYDVATSIALVQDQGHGILVDMQLCLPPTSSQSDHWAQQMKGTVMIIGHLERVMEPIDVPALPNYTQMPEVDPYFVLRAIMTRTADTLNMNKWREGINTLNNHFGGKTSTLENL